MSKSVVGLDQLVGPIEEFGDVATVVLCEGELATRVTFFVKPDVEHLGIQNLKFLFFVIHSLPEFLC